MLNPNTRVAVCGYAGDAHQVTAALRMYTHHECPLTILSPTDSRIEIPNVDCRFGGLRQYIGQLSLDRQREHLRILLEYPEEYFLINDSDSMCLSPKIPSYLYAQPDFLWSNLVVDNLPGREVGHYLDGFPRLAFQPPYFMNRKGIETLLACVEHENITANPLLPFIDHYMVQLAVKAEYPWQNFKDGISCPISSNVPSARLAWESVRHRGVVMIHSVKAPKFWLPLVAAHQKFLVDPRGLEINPFADPRDPPQPPNAPLQGRAHLQRQHLMEAVRRQALVVKAPSGLKA